MNEGLALLAAGGTGGHLFPAQSLALALKARGWRIHLATDHRVESYGQDFPAEKVHTVRSATLTRAPVAFAKGVTQLGFGFIDAWKLVRSIEPNIAIGFGGYPTVPPMLAAARAGVPTLIHEQNAVIGRANRFLAPRVTAIATGFATVHGAEAFRSRTTQTGNPVRPAVLEAAKTPYPLLTAETPLNLVVFGGSQGARFMSDLLPPAVEKLKEGLRRRLRIVQQCRPEDMDRVGAAYRALGVSADLQPFFRDMPQLIAQGHLIVCRSGASTCAELSVIGRPSIMIPLPGALDQDQKANAVLLAGAGGGWMVEQKDMTPERLASELTALAADPDKLSAAAAAARSMGRPDAVERLADLVEDVSARRLITAAGATP
jgi:UDP-N-acetylglucosamine--N-acetylmuramyl-(pentapeptide) pyrophosphoryl-undecaprenol N-acetylglucosamine transferase